MEAIISGAKIRSAQVVVANQMPHPAGYSNKMVTVYLVSYYVVAEKVVANDSLRTSIIERSRYSLSNVSSMEKSKVVA